MGAPPPVRALRCCTPYGRCGAAPLPRPHAAPRRPCTGAAALRPYCAPAAARRPYSRRKRCIIRA
jgi:hypothetical protein